jgi:hypothetical protein
MNENHPISPKSLKPTVTFNRRGFPKSRPSATLFAANQAPAKFKPASVPKVEIQNPPKTQPEPPAQNPSKKPN